jgi:hypothetical protein
MATLMAKGFVLGKDALAKAKARDVAPRRCDAKPQWLRGPRRSAACAPPPTRGSGATAWSAPRCGSLL